MKKEELLEIIREDLRNIILSHREGKISDEEYVEKMNAYNEICGALND